MFWLENLRNSPIKNKIWMHSNLQWFPERKILSVFPDEIKGDFVGNIFYKYVVRFYIEKSKKT